LNGGKEEGSGGGVVEGNSKRDLRASFETLDGDLS